MKVMTILGTRPEIIKLSRVIAELDRRVDHVLVHTGQNFDYELNEIFFRDLEIRKPDHFLEVGGGNLAGTIGNVIVRSDAAMEKEKPEALLLLGDTNSCLSAIPAKRRKIPIFHMEAGNRCFDQRVPEEVNRKIVDHVSDINLTYTEHARRYLLREGLRPETVIKTGSPMREVLEYHRPGIDGSEALSRLGLSSGEYFVVSAHREENVDDETNYGDLMGTLEALAVSYGIPVVVSTHPRTRKRLLERGIAMNDPRIRFLKPLGFLDYVKLQKNARCVVSDSGTITEESSILGFPAVTIRQAHERPEGMDEGTLIMCGLKPDHVLKAVEVVVAHSGEGEHPFRVVPDYEPRNVSKKVVRIILSYVEYVNRTVWFRFS
ncbi:MAG: UDP-N-acetylglucosamine 2-epimerase [Deltaproteobacteria bacterium RBG_19FT_COMBO_60_16]|nr:MAG: UDP-N-acetylglucosamine 2-epimerase [Deltaproteobacteria bacterium RBG_19FT_COMBO_60_16]